MTTPNIDFHTTVTESVAELFGWCWPYSETDVVWNKAFIKDAIHNMLCNGCVQIVMRYQRQLFSIQADGKGGYTRLRINWSAYVASIPAKERQVKHTKPAAWNREADVVEDDDAYAPKYTGTWFRRVGDELIPASEYSVD